MSHIKSIYILILGCHYSVNNGIIQGTVFSVTPQKKKVSFNLLFLIVFYAISHNFRNYSEVRLQRKTPSMKTDHDTSEVPRYKTRTPCWNPYFQAASCGRSPASWRSHTAS